MKKFKGLTSNPTKEYKIALLLIISFLIVFLTSKMWLPDASKIQQSEIGTKASTSPITELTLTSWEYNPELRFMEITISIQDTKNLNRSEFTSTAKISQSKSLPCEIVIKENGLMIVHITNVPKNFKVVSLWIDQKENSIIGAEQHKSVNFKCDYRKVITNNQLNIKNQQQYLLQTIDNEIAMINKKMDEIKQSIQEKRQQINQLQKDIVIIESDIKYQTQDEINNSQKAMDNKKQDIEFIQNQITTAEKNIFSLSEKLIKLNQKRVDNLTKQKN